MKGGKPTKPKPTGHDEACPCNLCQPKRKGPTAHGRTVPIFEDTKPYILAWLQRMAEMLKVPTIQAIDPSTPLFMSRVRNTDGSRRAISRETCWTIVKRIAREHQLSGIGTHSTRKTLAQRAYDHAKAVGMEDPMRFVQKILGHSSISSTEHYVRSLTSRQAWESYRSSLTLIARCKAILEEIQPATIRAVCYRLFVAGHLKSMSRKHIRPVYDQLKDARERGMIPWDWIVDETREPERAATWRDPDQFIRVVQRSYRRDYWTTQPHRIEVWSEKGTVRGTLAPVLDRYGVTFRVMHGFGSATAVHDVAAVSLVCRALRRALLGTGCAQPG